MNRIAELRAVQRVRHGSDYSQRALARRLGVSRQTLSSWENGTSEPTVTQAIVLARELGVSVEGLGYLED